MRRHPVYSFEKYNMHVKIFMASIQWFIIWYGCLVDSCKTHSVEKRCVVYFFITHCVGAEKHARLCSVGRSVCKKWSL